MGEPFRDEVSAALARVETLEDENEALRDEVERLRAAASSAGSPDLAAQATRVLEKLDALSERRPRVAEREVDVRAPSEERGQIDVSTNRELVEPPLERLVPPPARDRAATPRLELIVVACIACFVAGMTAHACLAGLR